MKIKIKRTMNNEFWLAIRTTINITFTIQYFMQFLQPKFVFFIVFLFSYNCIMHLCNLVYVRKIQILEELLHSKLRCTFECVRPIVKISGNYKGRKLIYWSCPWLIFRLSSFRLKSSKLPKQKILLFTYPQVAPGITREGDILVYRGDLWGSALSLSFSLVTTLEIC